MKIADEPQPSESRPTSEFPRPAKSGSDTKVEINALDQDLERITNKAWSAIEQANQPPYLFRYGDVPCRLECNDKQSVVVRRLTQDRLRHVVVRVADWFKMTPNGQQPAKPPMDVVKDMLAMPDPPLPVLSRITEVPVFAPEATLQIEPGYHPAAQVYYSPPEGFTVPKVSDDPTADDISRAKKLIFDELLVDFPFAENADRAHAVALFLLPYARDLIEGPTPNHLVESPTPGTGKDLLVDVCLGPAFGPSSLATLAQATDEEEWRRRITGCLKQPSGAILIGNVTRPLDSGVLAAALTARWWSDRILRTNDMIHLPVRHIWTTTANNPSVSTEIARRSIRIRIDSICARPWEREGFKHPNLRVWADEHRSELVWAALTLIQAWVAADKPLWQKKTLGSYEGWAEVMGGILEVNGVEGFLGNLDTFYEVADAEGSCWGLFVEKWWENFRENNVGVGALLQLAVEAGLELKGYNDHAQRVSLGMQLTRHRDQIIGRYRIVSAGKSQGAALWKLASESSES